MAAYLTAGQLAQRWNCSARHVRRLCASGELRALRLGADASWRVREEAIAEFEAAHTTSAETVQPSAPSQEVRPVTSVGGFTLPDDYEPVFKDLWNR